MSDQSKTITIRLARGGLVEAETHGLKGPECLPYIHALQELLQAEVIDSRFTEEYYETAGEVTEQRTTEMLWERQAPR